MSLRIWLLLLSLLTLVLPWAGCEYARQMEAVLSKGQGDALLATARVLRSVVAADDELLAESFAAAGDKNTAFATQLLTYALDGFADEWPEPSRPLPNAALGNLRLGLYGSAVIAFLHVADEHVVYEKPRDDDALPKDPIDRVVLMARDPAGVMHAWSISAVAPGPAIVRHAGDSAPWAANPHSDSDIRGVWRATGDGYDLELRIPRRLLGSQIALAPIDDALPSPPDILLRPLRVASEALRNKLRSYAPEGVRVSVVDGQGWLLARAGSLQRATGDDELPSFYRWLLARNEQAAPAYGLPYGMWGPPVNAALQGESSFNWFAANYGDPATIRAAIPILRADQVIGAISVEQTGEQLLKERDVALAGLFKVASLATVIAVLSTLAFAAWILRRIRRLSLAASTALSPEGRIELRLPEMRAHDELGDLSRSFASLLQRINEYASYLQTLGSKLSHEFRTPLAIVGSSLDNLAAESNDPAKQEQFIRRAREGTLRLQAILSAMTEATRVEQSIEQAEQAEFDLSVLLRSAATAYQQTFASHRFTTQIPEAPCLIRGAPDLVAQLLDKLIDNAIDFCPPAGLIEIALRVEPKHYVLTVSNEGPLLPPNAEAKLFDMLVTERNTTTPGGKPHLGLGLYIVQLIARFHHGEVAARNLPDASGVAFNVRFAR